MRKEDKERAFYVLAGFGIWLMTAGVLTSLAAGSSLRHHWRSPSFLAGLAFLCLALVLGNAP